MWSQKCQQEPCKYSSLSAVLSPRQLLPGAELQENVASAVPAAMLGFSQSTAQNGQVIHPPNQPPITEQTLPTLFWLRAGPWEKSHVGLPLVPWKRHMKEGVVPCSLGRDQTWGAREGTRLRGVRTCFWQGVVLMLGQTDKEERVS